MRLLKDKACHIYSIQNEKSKLKSSFLKFGWSKSVLVVVVYFANSKELRTWNCRNRVLNGPSLYCDPYGGSLRL